MSPLLVAHVRQAMDRHFRRFRRVLAAAAREAGIAAGLAEDALYLTLLAADSRRAGVMPAPPGRFC